MNFRAIVLVAALIVLAAESSRACMTEPKRLEARWMTSTQGKHKTYHPDVLHGPTVGKLAEILIRPPAADMRLVMAATGEEPRLRWASRREKDAGEGYRVLVEGKSEGIGEVPLDIVSPSGAKSSVRIPVLIEPKPPQPVVTADPALPAPKC